MKKKTAVVAFVPVVHAGYVQFFKEAKGDLFVLDKVMIASFPELVRDLRALDPRLVARLLSVALKKKVTVLTPAAAKKLHGNYAQVVMPDEKVSEVSAAKFFPKASVQFCNVFLRYDWKNADRQYDVSPARVVTTDELHRDLINKAKCVGKESPDWWRQIGAIMVRDGKILLMAFNKHLPHPHHQDTYGDPRLNYSPGERPDIYLSIHAETSLLVQALREGLNPRGTSVYVSTFPCANCARLLAEAGIAKLYYGGGYSMLEGDKVLKDAGVEIVLVQ